MPVSMRTRTTGKQLAALTSSQALREIAATGVFDRAAGARLHVYTGVPSLHALS